MTKEPGAPGGEIGMEAYNFVDKPNKTNPSAMWSNYTDCERLIYDDGLGTEQRYLLKCDALDCCTETQSGNQVEFQIPNVHLGRLTKVKHEANVSYTDTWKQTWTCDKWSWRFLIEDFHVYTTNSTDNSKVNLHAWTVVAEGAPYTIEFKNYTHIPAGQEEEFVKMFQVPAECIGSHVLPCSSAFEKGLLDEKWKELLYRPYERSQKLIYQEAEMDVQALLLHLNEDLRMVEK